MEKEFAFQWHITDLCNLRCLHCYQDRFDRQRDISLQDWKNILRDLAKTLEERGYSGLRINITGGEPLISPLLYPLLDDCECNPFIREVNIITNGLNLAEHSKALKAYKKIGNMKISLEGASGETNDAIRGAGNFSSVIRNIEGLPLDFLLMFTLTKRNFLEMNDMRNLARDVQANGVILERFAPLGMGTRIKESALDSEDWRDVLIKISHWAGCASEELIPYKAFYIDFKKDRISGALCNLGNESMALMPNADVYPCRRLPLVLGNLKNEDFSLLLERLTQFRDQFQKDRLSGVCWECPEPVCIGCRALAYALSHDLFAEDAQCPKKS